MDLALLASTSGTGGASRAAQETSGNLSVVTGLASFDYAIEVKSEGTVVGGESIHNDKVHTGRNIGHREERAERSYATIIITDKVFSGANSSSHVDDCIKGGNFSVYR